MFLNISKQNMVRPKNCGPTFDRRSSELTSWRAHDLPTDRHFWSSPPSNGLPAGTHLTYNSNVSNQKSVQSLTITNHLSATL